MKALPGIIVGLAAGALLGLLLAPQSGQKTRRRMGHKSEDFLSDLRDQLQEQLQDGLDKIRHQYNDQMDAGVSKAKDLVGQAERKVRF